MTAISGALLSWNSLQIGRQHDLQQDATGTATRVYSSGLCG
jgi:hypothetical protein